MKIPPELGVLGFEITAMIGHVRALNADKVEELLNLLQMCRGTGPSPEWNLMMEEMITLCRLALQWRNQLGEQARNPEELAALSRRAKATKEGA